MKKLYPHQVSALEKMTDGCILVGGTGSGKTLVGLAYYYSKVLGGSITGPPIIPTKKVDLYVITTARKRDELDWVGEATSFGLSPTPGVGIPAGNFVIDSWNNIKNYTKIKDSFFIFDEQRSSGRGVWARSLIRIARRNRWIMLSATPADKWTDLIPIFIANGFYKSRYEFAAQHIVYSPYTKFPKILRYINEEKLEKYREQIYVPMPFRKHTSSNIIDISVKHDQELITSVNKTEWNPYTDAPINNLAEHNFVVRRIVNQDQSRILALRNIFNEHKKLIVFYNYNFELELIKRYFPEEAIFEYNSKKHDPVPDGDSWLYLVQYMSGNEAWECFTTNHMVFYSLNYSYRITIQAMGRINRLNTPYVDLYYYRLLSNSSVDTAILKAFAMKKDFNDRGIKFT
jgi:superfamily II DNA or RNA helicase